MVDNLLNLLVIILCCLIPLATIGALAEAYLWCAEWKARRASQRLIQGRQRHLGI